MEAHLRSTLSEIRQDILSQYCGVTFATDRGEDGGGGSGMGAFSEHDSPSAGRYAKAPNIEPQTAAKVDEQSDGGTETSLRSAESPSNVNPPSAGPGSSSIVCDLIRELSSTFDAQFKQLGDEMQQV